MSSNRNRGRGGGSDADYGCLLWMMIGVFAMPLVGLYLISRKNDSSAQAVRWILLIVGIILWIYIGVKGSG